VVTPEDRDARNRAMIGTFLVVLGTGIMLERTFSNDLDVFWLAVGLSLIAGWLQAPRFLMFAVGSIITGFAAGGFLRSLVSIPFEQTISNLFAAAGFFAVYVRYPMRAKWALIPAAISAIVAVAVAGVEFIGFIPAAITGLMLPLLLIAGGALLLMRNALPPRIVKIGLAVIAVAFVASAASSVDRWDAGPDIDFGPPRMFGTQEFNEVIADLDDRTLVVETGSEPIDITTSSVADEVRVTALASRRGPSPGGIEVDEDDDTVRLLFRHDIPASWRIVVPEGTDLDLSTDRGLVTVEHTGGDVTVETDDGAVIADLRTDEGSLAVTTERGMIQVKGDGQVRPSIDAESDDGTIIVDGRPQEESYEREGSGADLTLDSEDGQIIVVGLAA